MEKFKVANKTDVGSLAGAITEAIRQEGMVSLQAVGAGAVNQSVKAVAKARGYLVPSGMDIVIVPSFEDFETGSEVRTGIVMEIKRI